MATVDQGSVSTTSDADREVPNAVLEQAVIDVGDVLRIAFEHSAEHRAIVVFDSQSSLSRALTKAYRRAIPDAQFIDFDTTTPETIIAAFDQLHAGDLVVLIQSTHFRLNAYRVRVELFKLGLKVIEHPHLGRMPGKQAELYLASLAYDPQYYRGTGHALKQKIDAAPNGLLDSGGEQLVYACPFESAKLNIGDYSAMPNIGGQFPIGEVFTEAKDLAAVNGRVRIFIFGDTTFSVNQPAQPITLVVERGQVTDVIDSTPEFDAVIANIKRDDGGVVWVRELGFGLNRTFTKDRTVSDIGTYERMCGIHLSLGSKHGIYAKPNLKRNDGRHHVDVFAVTEGVWLGDERVYQNGAWTV